MMKKMIVMVVIGMFSGGMDLRAQDPITAIIKEGITRVIRAFDLQVQRLQTETIWLQDAQKVAENAMQALHLDEIRDWVQQQKDLYGMYFQELCRVKVAISDYNRVKALVARGEQLVDAYGHALSLFQQDPHFTPEELMHMQAVYAGLMKESLHVLSVLSTVVSGFVTQMSDGGRLAIINQAANDMDRYYNELVRFNNQNALLSLQRARDQEDVDVIKKMYGL